jgi:diguanylate cyclase (GGDEF)-like protein
LTEFLDAEIKRFGRSQKPFAVLLLDLDHLKQINDTYGHLVGSRALCRLADVLRMNSREIDLAARYGGDEFVLVLPETEAASAAQVAQRISARLSGDVEIPALTVSTGVAVHPADGLTLDELFAAADRALYLDKSSPKANSHQAQ